MRHPIYHEWAVNYTRYLLENYATDFNVYMFFVLPVYFVQNIFTIVVVKSLPLKRFVSVFTFEGVPNGNARLLYWKPFLIFITYQSSSGLLLNFRRNSIIKLRGYFLAKHLNYCIIYQQLLIMWIDSIIFSNEEHGFCWKTASQVLWR